MNGKTAKLIRKLETITHEDRIKQGWNKCIHPNRSAMRAGMKEAAKFMVNPKITSPAALRNIQTANDSIRSTRLGKVKTGVKCSFTVRYFSRVKPKNIGGDDKFIRRANRNCAFTKGWTKGRVPGGRGVRILRVKR